MSLPLSCDRVDADALGTTVASVETIGTITLSSKAKRVLMLMWQVVSTGVMTTAEALMGKVVINSKDLGLSNFRGDAGINLGGSPATNIQAVESPLMKFPMDVKGKFGKATIDFTYDAILPEPTSEVAVQCFAIFDDESTPDKIVEALWRGYGVVTDHSDVSSDDEIGDALTEALDGGAIEFEGVYGKLIKYLANVSPDAVHTAGEHFLGYLEFASSYEDIGVQKWPLPAINAGLGTPVGSPVKVTPILLPWFFPKGDKKESFTPTAVLQQVTGGANAVQVTLGAQK